MYHCSTGKNPIHTDSSALTKEIESVIKLRSLKLVIESQQLSITILNSKGCIKN